MPRELFNQPLIESPQEPDDNDRIAFGLPGVKAAKNILWGYLKTLLQQVYNYLDFVPQNPNPDYKEGRVFFDDVKKSLSYFNDIDGVTVNMGQELLFRVYNGTAATISNGKVISPDETTVITLADAYYKDKSRLIAVATHDIPPSTWGWATRIGQVGDIDTSSYSEGQILYLGTNGNYATSPPLDGGYPAIVGVVDVVDATVGVITVDVNVSELTVEVTDTNGFPPDQKTGTTISVVDGTRTFSIAPTGSEFHFYQRGEKYEKDALESVVFADSEGNHWFYYDEGVLTTLYNPTSAQKKDIIINKCFISFVYWNATDNKHEFDIFEERHGISMSPQTHAYLHITRGAQFGSGYGLGNFVIDGDGSLDTHAQFSVESGAFFDEDIEHTFSGKSVGNDIIVGYLLGSNGYLRTETNTGFSVSYDAAGTLYYNQFTGGAWQKTQVGNNNFVLYHYFAMNGVSEQIVSLMGQAEYATISAAREAASTEISSIISAFDLQEAVPIATVLYKCNTSYTNTVSAAIQSIDTGVDYVDWRTTELQSGANPTSHLNLTDVEQAASGITQGHISDQAQTIAGIKTFSSFPITPSSAPTTDYEVANKKYVDDQIGGIQEGQTYTSDNAITKFDNNFELGGILKKDTDIDVTYQDLNIQYWSHNIDVSGGFNDDVVSFAVQSDGKVIVGGDFTTYQSESYNRIIRILPDGTIDTSFDVGTAFNAQVRDIFVDSLGKIIVVGSFTSYNGATVNRIVRLNNDGSIDTTFDIGTGFNASGFVIDQQSDGKYVIGGNFTSYNGTTRYCIVRINENGSLDTTFDAGSGITSVTAVKVLSNGQILAGLSSFYYARFSSTGSYVTSKTVNGAIYGFGIQADGKIVIAGAITEFDGTSTDYICRLTTSDTLDATFSTDGTGFNAQIYNIVLDSSDDIYCVGNFSTVNSVSKNGAVKLTSEGATDSSFNIGTGFNGTVWDIAESITGSLLVGGTFTTYNGSGAIGFAEVNATGGVPTNEILNEVIFSADKMTSYQKDEAEVAYVDNDGKAKFVALNLSNLPVYANNAAALTGGLVAGDLYKTASTGDATVMIVNAT